MTHVAALVMVLAAAAALGLGLAQDSVKWIVASLAMCTGAVVLVLAAVQRSIRIRRSAGKS